MEHELKTWPGPFAATWHGLKPYEFRTKDRDYKLRDVLRLKEYLPKFKVETGRQIVAEVTYITQPGAFDLNPEKCIMGLRILEWIANAPGSPSWRACGTSLAFGPHKVEGVDFTIEQIPKAEQPVSVITPEMGAGWQLSHGQIVTPDTLFGDMNYILHPCGCWTRPPISLGKL